MQALDHCAAGVSLRRSGVEFNRLQVVCQSAVQIFLLMPRRCEREINPGLARFQRQRSVVVSDRAVEIIQIEALV